MKAFVVAIAYELNRFSDEVISHVTDPHTGLPGKLKYPLEIADVKKACDAHQESLLREARWSSSQGRAGPQ
jgi:hypothetical protein